MLKTVDEFNNKISELKLQTNKEIAVFWDKGWGDLEEPLIDLIIDGDGQNPICSITEELYKELVKNKLIEKNTLITYKARKLHRVLYHNT